MVLWNINCHRWSSEVLPYISWVETESQAQEQIIRFYCDTKLIVVPATFPGLILFYLQVIRRKAQMVATFSDETLLYR